MTTTMPHRANSARLELAAGSPAQTHLSRAASNGNSLWVAGACRFDLDGLILGKDTGLDELLRRY